MNRYAIIGLLAAGLLLAGCGDSGDDKSRSSSKPAPRTDVAVSAVPAAPTATNVDTVDARARVAIGYAVAARSRTAATAARNRTTQLQLSTGPLRADIARTPPPTKADLAEMDRTRTGSSAELVSVTTEQLTASSLTLRVQLRERQWNLGSISEQVTDNRLQLQRAGDAWRVSAFTIVP